MILGLIAASITVQVYVRDNDGELVRQPDGSLLAVDATLSGAWVTLQAAVLGTGGADRRVTGTFQVWTSREAAEPVGTYVVDALADPARNTEQQAWEALIAAVGDHELVSAGSPTWWTGLGSSGARLWSLLSPSQRAQGLDPLFRAAKHGLVAGVALAGVEVISVQRQGLRLRSYVLARPDVGASALGEPAPAVGAVPLVEVQYRYRFADSGLVAGEGRVLYPLSDGSGYVVAPEAAVLDAWDYLGQASIDAGSERRRAAASRCGYLLGVGARVFGSFADPGAPIRTLLAILSGANGGYDLVQAYREYDDPTLRVALEAVDAVGLGVSWLDLDLGGVTARALALAELAEPTTDGDGWTAWPS